MFQENPFTFKNVESHEKRKDIKLFVKNSAKLCDLDDDDYDEKRQQIVQDLRKEYDLSDIDAQVAVARWAPFKSSLLINNTLRVKIQIFILLF